MIFLKDWQTAMLRQGIHEGWTNAHICSMAKVHPRTVSRWRKRLDGYDPALAKKIARERDGSIITATTVADFIEAIRKDEREHIRAEFRAQVEKVLG